MASIECTGGLNSREWNLGTVAQGKDIVQGRLLGFWPEQLAECRIGTAEVER